MSLEDIRKHRDNLVKLISEDAPTTKFLAELLELRKFFGYFPESVLPLTAKVNLNVALSRAELEIGAVDEKSKRFWRGQLLHFVSALVKDIDDILKSKQIKIGEEFRFERYIIPELENEQDIIKCFIEKGPLKGVWLFEVPVKLKEIKKAAREAMEKPDWTEFLDREKIQNVFLPMAKHIDLVCIENPEKRVVGRLDEKAYLISPIFSGRTVTLIEAKASEEKLEEAIEQILEYRKLFLEDWPNTIIKDIGVICRQISPKVLERCRKHNIRAWEVTCTEVHELT